MSHPVYGLNELREMFLRFFESKGHLRLPSFSLIPQNDKSILLINAGMTPMKPWFKGEEEPPRRRVCTCQKCIRTGDIDNVGHTARHGTFFEMLGNFSFGDYFKHEAIAWSWEFLTSPEWVGLKPDRLYPSVFAGSETTPADDEAFAIWRDEVGIPEERIFRFGKEDNFWEHGSGPCGPCSEIYYDRGAEYGCGKPGCTVGCDCDRYVEVWNNVFSQFDNDGHGNYTELKQKNIDTGMGLERLAMVSQNVNSLFDVDTVMHITNKVSEITGAHYGESNARDVSLRIITDHIRSASFMICDGVLPSNEGRGYVLRRLLRRAAQQAAQDVTAALVARQHAVADHEARGADVVGDDAQRDVARVALAVVRAGDLADLVGDVHDGIDVEQGVDILADHRQTLQTHAGVDVLLLELGVVAVAVVVELGKDVVPHLNIAVAVAADRAAGLTAAVLRAAVVVNFGAGTARTGAMLPEVILLAEAEDALLRNTDLVAPDGKGLVVRGRGLAAGEHRGVQAVRLQADPLGAGEELPRPGDRLMLEVVAEREVAEHLKEGAVARGVTDVVDIARADALLAGADAAARRLLLALEPGLHGGHARVDEQDGLVVLRDQGKAGQAQVALALKEAEEHLSQLVEAVNRMGHC